MLETVDLLLHLTEPSSTLADLASTVPFEDRLLLTAAVDNTDVDEAQHARPRSPVASRPPARPGRAVMSRMDRP